MLADIAQAASHLATTEGLDGRMAAGHERRPRRRPDASSTCTSISSGAGEMAWPPGLNGGGTRRRQPARITGRPSHDRQSSRTGGNGAHPQRRVLGDATTPSEDPRPGHQPMVALLGQRDAFLKLIESAFDSRDPRPRQRDHDHRTRRRGRAGRPLFEELLTLLERGHELTDSVRRPDDRDDQGGGDDEARRSQRGARRQAAHGARQGHHAEDARAEALRRRDPLARP